MTSKFDTLAFSLRLRSAGLDDEIADATTFALRDVLAGVPLEVLAVPVVQSRKRLGS